MWSISLTNRVGSPKTSVWKTQIRFRWPVSLEFWPVTPQRVPLQSKSSPSMSSTSSESSLRRRRPTSVVEAVFLSTITSRSSDPLLLLIAYIAPSEERMAISSMSWRPAPWFWITR